MKVLRGGPGVSGGSAAAVAAAARGPGAAKRGTRAAPDGHDGEARDEGVKFHVPGLALAELDEGQLDAPPGLQFVRHGGVGAAFVLFWLLVSCLRGAASRGPARGGAARRGGCGGVVGGCATSGTSFTWRLLLFGANLRNVGAPRMEPLRGNGFFRPGARGARWRGHQRGACRPRDPAGPPRGGARHKRSRDEQAGAGPSGRRSFRCPAVAGGAGQRRNDVGEPAAQPKNGARANPSARAAKQKHANRRPTSLRRQYRTRRRRNHAKSPPHPTQLTNLSGAPAASE